MSALRIGIIGTGFIANWHANGFRAQPDAAIAGFAGGATRAAALAAEHGGRAYDSIERMLDDPAVDAVVIGSINPLHHAHVVAAIERRKPCLAEKPVAVDPAQLADITARARRVGALVFPGHNFLYRPAVAAARRAIDGGVLGRPVHASFVSVHTISAEHAGGWRGRLAESGGGALMDSGHHQVYQSLHLCGRPVSVQAFTARRVLAGMEGEDLAQVALQYADGSTATIVQSWATGHGGRVDGINILGTDGDVVISDRLYVRGQPQEGATGYDASFAGQARAFIDAVRHGGRPVMGLDGAADTLALIATAYRSASEGRVLPFHAASVAACASAAG